MSGVFSLKGNPMTDPKAAAAAPKAETKSTETKATDQSTTRSSIFLAIGRLRRDLLIVAQGEAEQVAAISKAAVLEGRAAEVFVVEAVGYFSESEVRWDSDAIDQSAKSVATPADSGPLLNIHPSAAKAVKKAEAGKSELEPTTVQAERAKAAEASRTTADLVDGQAAQEAALKSED